MNLKSHPELLDQLAASYALGTLRAGARRRFETLARDHASVRARALLWQESFASLTELQRSDVPGPNVWKRIENQLPAMQRDAAAKAAQPGIAADVLARLRRSVGLWRGAAFAGALVAVATVLVGVKLDSQVTERDHALALATGIASQLSAQLRAVNNVEYVAVLADDKAAPSILVTFDPNKKALTLKRVGGFQEAADQSLQLWAVPPSGKALSLGVLDEQPLVRLVAAEGQVAPMQALAVSLEKKGGVPDGQSAAGPVLFVGKLLKTTL